MEVYDSGPLSLFIDVDYLSYQKYHILTLLFKNPTFIIKYSTLVNSFQIIPGRMVIFEVSESHVH